MADPVNARLATQSERLPREQRVAIRVDLLTMTSCSTTKIACTRSSKSTPSETPDRFDQRLAAFYFFVKERGWPTGSWQRKVSTSVPTVLLWRKRFETDGIGQYDPVATGQPFFWGEGWDGMQHRIGSDRR